MNKKDLMDKGLVIATGNPGKIKEFRRILEPEGIKIYGLQDFPPVEEPIEDADTFQGNARIKAAHAYENLKRPVLADDSGLCVDALNGEPGVKSARYGGSGLDDRGRRTALLASMKDKTLRSAHFSCVLAVTSDGKNYYFFEGRTDGEILFEESGADGFGYDSIFFCSELGKSFGEASKEEKDMISHRGRAIRKFLKNQEESNTP